MTLFLALAAIALVLARHYCGRFAPSARQYVAALGVLAAASLIVYLNFFSFHGAHTGCTSTTWRTTTWARSTSTSWATRTCTRPCCERRPS